MSLEELDSQLKQHLPIRKSTFSAYIQSDVLESPCISTKNLMDATKQKGQKHLKLLQQRQTDGYFNTNDKHGNDKFTSRGKCKHIFSRRATYLPKVDKIRISMGIRDEYRQFQIDYMDTGFGVIINIISWTFNCYMAGFCRIMKFFGSIENWFENKYSSKNVGFGMMILSNTLYLVPTLFIKCNPHIDFSLAVMTRGIVALILIFQMAHVKGQELTSFPNHDIKLLVYRGFFSSISQLFFFFSLGKLPLSINVIISNTGPIFVFVLSVIFFNGKMFIKDVVGIIVSLFGVFCVSNPSYLQGIIYRPEKPFALSESKELNDSQDLAQVKYHYVEGIVKLVIICSFFLINVGWAYGVLVVKQLQKANTLAMNFFVAIGLVLIGSLACLYRPPQIYDLSASEVFQLIFLVGVFSFGSQYTFITSTFLNHDHGPLTMLGYLTVVKSYIIQVMFFDEIPCTAEIIGSLLVLFGVAKIVIN